MSKDIADSCRDMFKSRISAGATEKLPIGSGKPGIDVSSDDVKVACREYT